jgi:hypothetical protein
MRPRWLNSFFIEELAVVSQGQYTQEFDFELLDRPRTDCSCFRTRDIFTLSERRFLSAGSRFALDDKELGPPGGNNYPESGLVKPPRCDIGFSAQPACSEERRCSA